MPLGQIGTASVVSLHATKIIHSLEGGFILTTDDALASKLRLMRNFGFTGYDKVDSLGINAKMNEISALVGYTNTKNWKRIAFHNFQNRKKYKDIIDSIDGISLLQYPEDDINNYHYVVAIIDESVFPLTRDEFVERMHAQNILVRRYFYPGCHLSPVYSEVNYKYDLPNTDVLSSQVVVFPNGLSINRRTIYKIGRAIRKVIVT